MAAEGNKKTLKRTAGSKRKIVSVRVVEPADVPVEYFTRPAVVGEIRKEIQADVLAGATLPRGCRAIYSGDIKERLYSRPKLFRRFISLPLWELLVLVFFLTLIFTIGLFIFFGVGG